MESLLPLLALVAATAICFGWLSSAALPGRLRALSLALRLLAVAGLALLAVNPGEWRSPVEREDSDWVVLLDRSASMAVKDAQGATRWHAALQLAQDAVAASDDARRARVLTFGGHLDEEVGMLPAVRQRVHPDADGTDVTGALTELFARYQARQRRLAGVLLVSDGRQQAAGGTEDAARMARALAAPVHALAVGGPVRSPDLSIEARRALEIGFAGQPLRVQARIRNAHPTPVRPSVRLLDASGREVAATAVELAPGATTNAVVSFTPPAGSSEYQWTVDGMAGDAIPDNNRSPLAVIGIEEPLRVLLAEGVPHWDSKFLIQWFRKQPQFRLTTVHRLAGERFFRAGAEGGADAQTREIFPDSAAELESYDVIIFGQGVEYFLTSDRVRLLRRFVSERGGCVLFARAKPYSGSFPELAELEPLAWDAPVPADAATSLWRPTADGEESGLFGGTLPGAQDAVWGRLPRIAPQHFTRALPSFSIVLAAAEGGTADRTPLVAAKRYGKGRTAAVNAADLWRWDFFPASEESAPLYKAFWPELVQWLAVHGDFLPGRSVALRLSASRAAPGEPVQAIVQTRGKAAADKANPILRIVSPSRATEEVQPHPLPDGDGWSAVFAPSEPGLYRLEAALPSAPGAGTAVAMLSVRRAPAEGDELSADPEFLEALARASGGSLAAAADVPQIVASFAARAPDETEAPPVWRPVWDRAWILALLLGAMGLEWFVRRRNGLY